MNRYAAWKYILLAIVVLVGAIYALPNLYGEDPALQISGTRNAVLDVDQFNPEFSFEEKNEAATN